MTIHFEPMEEEPVIDAEGNLIEIIYRIGLEVDGVKQVAGYRCEPTKAITEAEFKERIMRELKADVTLPRPVTKDKYGKRTRDYTREDWIKAIFEEVNEVINARTREHLAEELTDLKTVCTSYQEVLGYDEEARGELQRQVNDKNLQRGYFEE